MEKEESRESKIIMKKEVSKNGKERYWE